MRGVARAERGRCVSVPMRGQMCSAAISSCLIIPKIRTNAEKPNDSTARTSTSDSMSNTNGSVPKLARTASFGVRSPTVGYSGPWRLQNA